MATQNAIDTNKPIGVDDGGTGAATLTDHGVLVGSGTGAITALAVGTTGQLLVGVTGADPAFASSASADFTFEDSVSGGAQNLYVANTSNTASSDAVLKVSVGGTSAGDPYTGTTVTGSYNFVHGIDNSDSDKFKLSASTALGTTDVMEITSAGEVTKPLQPAFLAYLGTNDLNVTGDFTNFTLGSGNALTEVYDQGGDFVTTGTFTAPVTGRYSLNSGFRAGNIGAHTSLFIGMVTSNGSYFPVNLDPSAVKNSNNEFIGNISVEVDMDASDTAYTYIQASGSTKTVGIITAQRHSFFSGHLIC